MELIITNKHKSVINNHSHAEKIKAIWDYSNMFYIDIHSYYVLGKMKSNSYFNGTVVPFNVKKKKKENSAVLRKLAFILLPFKGQHCGRSRNTC